MTDLAEENKDKAAEEVTNDSAEAEAADKAETKEETRKEKKKSKADKELEAAKARIAELEDKSMRQMAEFQNFRNRTEKEKAQMFDMGAKSVIEKMLPVVDNFERGLATLSEEEKATAFADGIGKVYRQLMTELESIGVKPIDAKGKEFNPDFHNAVMQVESDELESGIVAEELMKGYTYHDTVVRHSMVSVVS